MTGDSAHDVPAGWAEQLRWLTASLNSDSRRGHLPADPGLGDDVASYVLTGEPADVTSRLGRQDGVVLRVDEHYKNPAQVDHDMLLGLYADLDAVPADMWLRWFRALANTQWDHDFVLNVHQGGPWVEVMLRHLDTAYTSADGVPVPVTVSLGQLNRILQAGGSHTGHLVVALFTLGGRLRTRRRSSWEAGDTRPWHFVARMPEFGHAVAFMHKWVAPRLVTGDVEERVFALQTLGSVSSSHLDAYAEQIVEAATTGSAQVREAAGPIAMRAADAVEPHLRRLATEGKPEQRGRALALLWQFDGEERREWVRNTVAADRSVTVRETLAALEEQPADSPMATQMALPSLPDLGPQQWAVEWTAEVEDICMLSVGAHGLWSPDERSRGQERKRFAPSEALELIRAALVTPEPVTSELFDRSYSTAGFERMVELAEDPAVTPAFAVQLLRVLGRFDDFHWRQDSGSLAGGFVRAGRLTLDELAALVDGVGVDGVGKVVELCNIVSTRAENWPDEAVWPFFARHLDEVAEDWRRRRRARTYGFDAEAFLRAVGTFPEPPGELVEELFDLALGSLVTDRRAAQDALARHPQLLDRVVGALGDRAATTRAVAAEWLARMAVPEAVPALEGALAKETHDVAKAALLDALVAYGKRVEDYVDREDLDQQARQALRKGLPAMLAWLRPDELPGVHWADTGDVVSPETLLQLVVQAAKSKSPEPNALLRTYVTMVDERQRAAYGVELLRQWVTADEDPSRLPQAWGEKVSSSPVSAKGAFGVVAVCGGADSVSVALRYIKAWHGQRPVQSKSLVTMLEHHSHPAAAEALVAIGYRFKAPSIRKAAAAAVEAIAARRGWSIEELADRTVPTGGFDDAGRLEVSYGPRNFTLVLRPDLTVAVLDGNGKESTALPAPRASDDAESAREARATLSSTRKALKQTAALQTARLHGAWCTQREWPGPRWRQDLAGHPVLRHLVGRLVWRAQERDGFRGVRLLDDGTVTDAHDELVLLDEDAVLTLAHSSTLGEDEVAAWRDHLADYEVTPPFDQFGRPLVELTETARASTEVGHLKGVKIDNIRAMRGRAQSLGWSRGPVGDAAMFNDFRKDYPDLGITVILWITGAPVEMYDDEPVEVGALSFERGGRQITLGDIPPVLFAEAWHDVHSIAGVAAPEKMAP